MAPKKSRGSKVDVRQVKKRNPPLAKVVQAIFVGQTNRDSGGRDVSQDIAIALNALDKSTPLGKALDEFIRTTDLQTKGSIAKERDVILRELDEAKKQPEQVRKRRTVTKSGEKKGTTKASSKSKTSTKKK